MYCGVWRLAVSANSELRLTEINGTADQKRRSRFLAAAGLLLVLAGPITYVPLMDVPLFRNTGLSVWLLGASGVLLALLATRRSHGRGVRAVAVICVLLPIAFVGLFFELAKLPRVAESTLATTSQAPEFTLPDHTGEPVALSALRRTSAVLLVFYRGHW